MASSFQEKSSKIFLTIFIGFIAISFMFTGYESMRGTPETIAKVGDLPITIGEFQRAYQQQESFYNQIYGGNIPREQRKSLNSQTMDRLVQNKLRVVLAEKLGVVPSNNQIKAEIKKYPAFQNNGAFDLNRYKLLLANNGLTPAKFEDSMKEQVKSDALQAMMTEIPVSKSYLNAVQEFRSKEFRAQLVSLRKSSLTKHLPISKSEIATYLKDEANKKRVESTFKSRKASLDKPEEVQARHILLKTDGTNDAAVKKRIDDLAKKVNASNFAKMAKKHSEGPSKTKGGELGWFAKGRMVKEFEAVAFKQRKGTVSKPVKTQFGYHLIYVTGKKKAVVARLEKHRDSIAKEFIQKGKTKEVTEFVKNLASRVEKNFKASDLKAVDRMQKKYGVQFEKNITVNQLDGATGRTAIKAEFLAEIFSKDLNSTNYYTFNEGDQIIVLKTSKMVETEAEKKSAKDRELEVNGLKTTWARKANQNMMQSLQEVVKVRIFDSRMRQL